MSRSSQTITLDQLTKEKLEVTVAADADPTGLTVEFAMVLTTAEPEDADWNAGEWVSGSWSSTRQTAKAQTPTIGTSGTLVGAEGSSYGLWWRVTTASERPVRRCATIRFV